MIFSNSLQVLAFFFNVGLWIAGMVERVEQFYF